MAISVQFADQRLCIAVLSIGVCVTVVVVSRSAIHNSPLTSRLLAFPCSGRRVDGAHGQNADGRPPLRTGHPANSSPYDVRLMPVLDVWGNGENSFLWPPSVIFYSLCRHPNSVKVCLKPRKRFVFFYYGGNIVDSPPADKLSHFGCCDGVDMVYTSDLKMLPTADVVEFSASYLPVLPRRGHRNQLFMATSLEGQYNVRDPSRMAGINLLRTFSSHNDIPHSLSEPGECFCKKYLQPLKVPYEKKLTVPVSAVVSNCASYGKREVILKYLLDTLPVHSYGRCFHNRAPSKANDMEELVSRYPYHFAVENGVCVDYITEKFSRGLLHGAVPIVVSQNGMPGYEYAAPNRDSYVDLASFPSLQDAVNFIGRTTRSKEAYQRHHSHRGQPLGSPLLSDKFRKNLCERNEDDLEPWCRIVRLMESRRGRASLLRKSYGDYKRIMEEDCAPKGSMAELIPHA